MILVSQKRSAAVPYPCDVYIEKDGDTYDIYAGNTIHICMGKYTNVAAAKLELNRLIEVYAKGPTKPETFFFMKEG